MNARQCVQPIETIGVTILAGGRSSRMGQDKSRLRWRGRTMVGLLRSRLQLLDRFDRIRVQRHDQIPHCGPLSGIYTALRTSRAEFELILACDMPLVPVTLLEKLVQRLRPPHQASFVRLGSLVGFPCVLRGDLHETVLRRIRSQEYALQDLARALNSVEVRPTKAEAAGLLNVNTPEDWARAKQLLAGEETSPRRSATPRQASK